MNSPKRSAAGLGLRKHRGTSEGARSVNRKDSTSVTDWQKMPAEKKDVMNLTLDLKFRDLYASPEDAVEAIQTFADANGQTFAFTYSLVEELWEKVTDDHRVLTIIRGWQDDATPEVGRQVFRSDKNWCGMLKMHARLARHAKGKPSGISPKLAGEQLGISEVQARRLISEMEKQAVLLLAREHVPHVTFRLWWMPAIQPREDAPASTDTTPAMDTLDTTDAVDTLDAPDQPDTQHAQDAPDTQRSAVPSDTPDSRDIADARDAPTYSPIQRSSAVQRSKRACPACDGEGCKHCHDTGYLPSIEAQARVMELAGVPRQIDASLPF